MPDASLASPVRVAVIGAGMAGRSHAHAYRTAQTVFGTGVPPVRLVAIADINPEFASHTAQRYGFERAETSWQAIAAAEDIDAVSIVVANHLHREVADALLAAGKHVLCEKPLADSVEDAEAMVAAAAAAARVASCGFSYRRSPAVAAIGEQIRVGSLGDIVQFNGRYWCDYTADPNAPTNWRDGHAAGVPVGDQRGPVTNDDIATFVVEFANGSADTFSISRVAHGHPNDLAFEVFGTKAAARFDLSRNAEFGFIDHAPDPITNGWRRVVVGAAHPYIAAAQSMPFAGVGHGGLEYFTYQARAFLDQIPGLDRLPAHASFADGLRNLKADGLRNLKVEAAVVRAALTGSTVELN